MICHWCGKLYEGSIKTVFCNPACYEEHKDAGFPQSCKTAGRGLHFEVD